jgi:hypothetical protein
MLVMRNPPLNLHGNRTMVATCFGCPSCQAVLQLAHEPPAGAQIRCPQCKKLFDAQYRAGMHAIEASHQPTLTSPPPSTHRLRTKTKEVAPPQRGQSGSESAVNLYRPLSGYFQVTNTAPIDPNCVDLAPPSSRRLQQQEAVKARVAKKRRAGLIVGVVVHFSQ